MMSIRAMIVAGLLGVPLFAGAALAAEAGNLSLAEAAKQGNREVVASLLSKRGEEDLGGVEGTDALIWAATRNDGQMADLLLRAGADPKGANEYGATALYAAAANTDAAMTVRLLAAGADPNAHLLSGETPLMEAARRGNLETVRALLPLLDDFERSLKVETADREYAKGIELIYQRFFESLKKLGLEPIVSAGQTFDPHIHHAVEMVETADVPDHTVLEEYQRGFNFKGRLLRAAMVKVAVEPSSK